jgi:hypothetical protein
MSSGLSTALLPLINVLFKDAAHRSPIISAGIIIRVSLIYQGIFGDCPDRHSLCLSAKLDFSLLKR